MELANSYERLLRHGSEQTEAQAAATIDSLEDQFNVYINDYDEPPIEFLNTQRRVVADAFAAEVAEVQQLLLPHQQEV